MTFRYSCICALIRVFSLVFAVLLPGADVSAQVPPDPQPVPASTIPLQTELNLINIPTTRSIQRHHSYFRLTHRFARDLRRGDFGELASDLFSLDNGAVIGVEYRFGITSNLHAGVNRSMLSKTIQTFARWDALRQSDSMPFSASLMASYEGLNNLQENHQPGAAITISRTFGDALALYATPAFVWDSRAVDFLEGHDHDHDLGEVDEHADHEHTAYVGLGARIRFSKSGYLVGEYSPRVYGYDPNRGVWGVGLEKRTDGHTLQLNLTNAFGTTLGQLARGGSPHDIYLGFNITRQF
jgi:hypothetical protein